MNLDPLQLVDTLSLFLGWILLGTGSLLSALVAVRGRGEEAGDLLLEWPAFPKLVEQLLPRMMLVAGPLLILLRSLLAWQASEAIYVGHFPILLGGSFLGFATTRLAKRFAFFSARLTSNGVFGSGRRLLAKWEEVRSYEFRRLANGLPVLLLHREGRKPVSLLLGESGSLERDIETILEQRLKKRGGGSASEG